MYFLNFKTFLTLLVISSCCIENICVQVSSQTANSMQTKDYVVKLAIFGDSDFGQLFQHNEQNILRYWEAVMYDLHLRFQTLPSLNISFHVTSLTTFKSAEEQPFLEKTFNKTGFSKHDLSWNFQSWIYSNRDAIPAYNIAVLLIGNKTAQENGDVHYYTPDSICWGDTKLILPLNPEVPKSLAESVARIMGAYTELIPPFLRTGQCCMLVNYQKSWPPRFFSPRTDKVLSEKLDGCCLHDQEANKNAIINSYKLFRNPSLVRAYTMQEQCNMIKSNSNPRKGQEDCRLVPCVSYNSPEKMIIPLEGSICGETNKGRCLRGVCIEPTFYLRNVATGKCLVPECSQFASNDKAVLRDCSKVPMDSLISAEMQRDYSFDATTLYSTSFGAKKKKLVLDIDSELRFERLSVEPAWENVESIWSIEGINWDFGVVQRNREFFLKHKETGNCAIAEKDGFNVVLSKSCSISNIRARWNFLKARFYFRRTT